MSGEPQHWVLARRLQAIAQNGLTYATNEYDRERYETVSNIAAQLMELTSGAPAERFRQLFALQSGYATPKVDVRAAAFRDGKVLLIREAADGLWTLPGGWADVNDSPSEAVVREVREESGFDVRVTKLAAVYDRAKHPHEPPLPFHVYKMFFLCEIVGGAMQTSAESLEVAFFGPGELPPLSTTRILPKQVARMFEHWRNPSLPADCD